ncbi:TA system VapC family ribonuclease toxin [Cyanobium sp. Aljojuca 7D2]|uniref:TA system VapC family ribonuclease toxin n=1 Tax=Cyanobium sp. Aljojuca 7D2 TaxID=2823698 RepID=UPI0020CB7A67|nr:TA system VapC family ribonuclease toxin [Cyanobium sp. Aljojuca 7D2]
MIPVALLDANVLIALIDPRHVHHDSSHRWFSSRGEADWASCAVTQNAVLRIVGHPRYPNSPGSPAVVSRILQELVSHPQHQFWAEAPSLLGLEHVTPSALVESGQITDTFLLALAVQKGGVLASLDRRLSTFAVAGGQGALELIPTDATPP